MPFRSQKVERKEIRGRICSPTSVSMVLAYRGVDRPTEEVAQTIFDESNRIFGNWPRAVAGAAKGSAGSKSLSNVDTLRFRLLS